MFGGFQFFPPMIKMLLIINTAVFLLQLILQSFSFSGVPLYGVFIRYFALLPLGNGFLPWQLVTYQFLHAGFLHIFFNMIFGLWMFGMEIEHIWGSKKFLIFYLGTGVVGGLFQLFLAPLIEGNAGYTIGASGAVYGLLAAFAMLFPDRYIFFYFFIPMKAKYLVIVLFILGFVLGGGEQIAYMAHVGGAVAGYCYLLYDRRRLALRRSTGTFQSWMASKPWSRPSSTGGEIIDAKVYDIKDSDKYEPKAKLDEKEKPDEIQKRIDGILDKISRSGYQSLTEEEKKVLFEASKRMN